MKKLFFIFFALPIFYSASYALQITEVMYEPKQGTTGRWFEVYNETGSSINLTLYKFYELTSTSSAKGVNHNISTTTTTITPNINPGEYVVIADDPTKFKDVPFKVFNSSFNTSFANGGTFGLRLGAQGSIDPQIAYSVNMETKNTGRTISYVDGNWVTSIATPGQPNQLYTPNSTTVSTSTENQTSAPTPTTSTTTTTSSSTTSTTSSSIAASTTNDTVPVNFFSQNYTGLGRYYTLGDMKMWVPKEMWVTVGADTEFLIKNIDSKSKIVPAYTYWSFGDGAEGYGVTTTHRYYNAGEYVGFVESQSDTGYGIQKIDIHASYPNIVIREVGDYHVLISNQDRQDIDIGGFILASNQGMFKLSRHLLVKANTDIKIDGRVLGFGQLTNVRLLTPNQMVMATYNPTNTSNNEYNNLATVNNLSQKEILNTLNSVQVKEALTKNTTNKSIKVSNSNIKNKNITSKIDESMLDKTRKPGTVTENNKKSQDSYTSPSNSQTKKSLFNWLYE